MKITLCHWSPAVDNSSRSRVSLSSRCFPDGCDICTSLPPDVIVVFSPSSCRYYYATMGKDHGGPLTAKAIGKKIKAKGLQKLKFYCQMCQKQCRDANGFKCHMTSEAHQRQLLLFAENPNKYLGSYSDEFLKPFLYLLRTRFGTRRVSINTVYQEYIKDKDHTHLNATRWVTLTGLAKWMGRKGICDVEETEKGWMVSYIDRDPETLKRQENRNKKEKLDKDYEERLSKIIDEQIERGKQAELERKRRGEDSHDEESQDRIDNSEASTSKRKELVRSEEGEGSKIAFSIPIPKLKDTTLPSSLSSLTSSSKRSSTSTKSSTITSSSGSSSKRSSTSTKKSALEELKEEQERIKAKKFRRDYWLTEGIVVKVITKSLGDKYYKKKGVVKDVIDKYEGVIEMIDSGDRIKLDQAHVETVIPNVGRTVKVVNGPYTGATASLLEVNFDSFCCKIKLESGPFTGRTVEDVKYEDICKPT